MSPGIEQLRVCRQRNIASSRLWKHGGILLIGMGAAHSLAVGAEGAQRVVAAAEVRRSTCSLVVIRDPACSIVFRSCAGVGRSTGIRAGALGGYGGADSYGAANGGDAGYVWISTPL
jgi:hypothetical protein